MGMVAHFALANHSKKYPVSYLDQSYIEDIEVKTMKFS